MEKKKRTISTAVCLLAVVGLVGLLFSDPTARSQLVPTSSCTPGCGNPSVPAGPLSEMYIKFDGVSGEAEDKDHQGWCNAISFRQGMYTPDSGSGGSVRPGGNVVMEEVLFVKEIDKASPKLAESICQGKTYPKVDIHLMHSYTDAGPVTYYKYEFKNVRITSYMIGGSGYCTEVPVEEITFTFEEIKATYTEYDSTGHAQGNVEYSHRVDGGGIMF